MDAEPEKMDEVFEKVGEKRRRKKKNLNRVWSTLAWAVTALFGRIWIARSC